MENMFTVKDLANFLKVTPATIYRLVEQGKLPTVRIGRAIRFDPVKIDLILGVNLNG